MSRPSAEYVREEPASQPFDVIGLVAGALFAFVGLAYLVGGHDALSGHESLVLPIVLVLVGVAGVAGSGLVRRSWFSRTPAPAAAGNTSTLTEDLPRAEPAAADAPVTDDDPYTSSSGTPHHEQSPTVDSHDDSSPDLDGPGRAVPGG